MSMVKVGLLIVGLIGAGFVLRPLASAPGSLPIRPPVLLEHPVSSSTLLVLGLDRRGTEIARTDTILLVRIGPPGQPPNALSIPRDLWVRIPGKGEDRINTAFAWGELGTGNGASLARRTIEEEFGVRVDRVAVVDFSCFQAAVDAAGSITIDVPQRIVDESYPAENGAATRIVFEPGRLTFTGERALQYVRTRAADSDFGRIRRQQQVLSAIANRAQDPMAAMRIARSVLSRCPEAGTDISLADLALLSALSGVGVPRFQLLDESTVTPVTLASGAQVLQPRWERIHPLVADIFGRRQTARPT
jgi:LCP family protein required for cell wall assembly